MRDVNSVFFGKGRTGEASSCRLVAHRESDSNRPTAHPNALSGALGQAGDGGEQDQAEYPADDAQRGKEKTLPASEAVVLGFVEEISEIFVELNWQKPGEAGAEAPENP
jgi:hypothetical protein